MENNKGKRRLNVIDAAIIIILVLAIVGVGLRFVMVKNTPETTAVAEKSYDRYLVSFVIREKRYEYLDYLKAGDTYRYEASNDEFGTLTDDCSAENAEKRYSFDGKNYTVTNEAEDEHQQKFDISGTFEVEGTVNGDGILFTKNATSTMGINLGSTVSLRGDFMMIKVTVTDITKVNG